MTVFQYTVTDCFGLGLFVRSVRICCAKIGPMITLEDRASIKLFAHNPDAGMLRYLLEADIVGASTSFEAFEGLRQQFLTKPPQSNSIMMYHAKCYICAVRRVARILERMVSNRSLFPEEVRMEIKTQWKRKKSFLEKFRESRDAIEHIDEQKTYSYCNLSNNVFTVVDGKSISLDRNSLEKLLSIRLAIDTAIDKTISSHIDTVCEQSRMIDELTKQVRAEIQARDMNAQG